MDKWSVVHLHNAVWLTKNKWAIKTWKTQRKLKCIILNERNKSEKAKYCMISTTLPFGEDKTMDMVEKKNTKKNKKNPKQNHNSGGQGLRAGAGMSKQREDF